MKDSTMEATPIMSAEFVRGGGRIEEMREGEGEEHERRKNRERIVIWNLVFNGYYGYVQHVCKI